MFLLTGLMCVCSSEYTTALSEHSVSPSENIYECEFDEDFDIDVPVGQCKALYDFDGELLSFLHSFGVR